jgi:hypothetical protein
MSIFDPAEEGGFIYLCGQEPQLTENGFSDTTQKAGKSNSQPELVLHRREDDGINEVETPNDPDWSSETSSETDFIAEPRPKTKTEISVTPSTKLSPQRHVQGQEARHWRFILLVNICNKCGCFSVVCDESVFFRRGRNAFDAVSSG